MDSSLTTAPKKRKVVVKKETVEDPRQKEKKEALNAKSVSLRKFKQQIDKTRRLIDDAKKKLPMVADKGYPKEMTVHFDTSLGAVLTECEGHAKRYGDEASKAEGDDIEAITATAESIDGACKELEKLTDGLKKTTVANINNVTK